MSNWRKMAAAFLGISMVATTLTPAVTVRAEEVSGKVELWNDKLATEDPTVVDSIAQGATEASGLEVTINSYPDVAAYQTALQQSIKEPEAPGMFTWWSGSQLETLATNGMIEDLTDIWEKYIIPAGVPESVADAFTIDGKIYAAPYCALYTTVLYNPECFEQAGITEEPKTFDEFLEACGKLKEAGITPIGLKNDSWASFIWFQQMLGIFDPQLYEDVCSGAKPYTDEAVKSAMEAWKGMFDEEYFGEPVSIQDLRKDFATGKVAMYLDVNSEIPVLNRDYGVVSGEQVDSFAMPSAEGGKSAIFFEAAPICVASASADKASAKKVLETWYGPEVQSVFTNDFGMANTSSIESEDPTVGKIVGFTGDTDNYELHLRFYENTPEDLRNYAIDELARFMYSGADIDEVLTNIQAEADKAFAE